MPSPFLSPVSQAEGVDHEGPQETAGVPSGYGVCEAESRSQFKVRFFSLLRKDYNFEVVFGVALQSIALFPAGCVDGCLLI